MMSFDQFLKEVCEIPVDKLSQYERWVAMYRERLKTNISGPEDPSPAPFLESLGSIHAAGRIPWSRDRFLPPSVQAGRGNE